jgi:hypothetical protein
MTPTSNDLMEMMAALEEAGIKKPAHFLGLLHECGFHVVKNPYTEVEVSIPQCLRRSENAGETEDRDARARAAE